MAFGDKREFHTMKCLGYGAFGVTLQVQYIPPGMPRHAIKVPEYYAVKVELVEHEDANQLQFEARLYSMLADAKIKHFPKIYHVSSTPQMRVMVMDLMGPNLESCLEACNGRFSEKTIYMIACEGLRRLRDLHDFGFLHRDIKPENFLVPYGKRPGPITLVDMGMCKRYFDPATKQHVPMQRGDSFQGTLRFASIQQHLFLRQSRRDDLQSFAYMLIYFWYGTLPWQGLQPRVDAHIRANARHETPPARDEIDILLERPQDKADAIRQIKYKMRDDLLCGKAPRVLKDFLVYTKQGLGYETRPDYDACITMFEEAARRAGIALDGRYDWCG